MASRPAYFARLMKFLRRKGRSREDAEDLIQEAMLRLHVYGRDTPVVNEEAFLRHAAYNLSIDQHRQVVHAQHPRQPHQRWYRDPALARLDALQPVRRIPNQTGEHRARYAAPLPQVPNDLARSQACW